MLYIIIELYLNMLGGHLNMERVKEEILSESDLIGDFDADNTPPPVMQKKISILRLSKTMFVY